MEEGFIQNGGHSKIISEIIAGRRTGDLQCLRPHEEKHIFFREGEIVFASTNIDSERIGQLMLKNGLVEPVMLEAVLKIVGPGKRTGRVLVAEGVLTPERLVKTVEAFLRRVVSAMFSWRDGQVRFTEGETPVIDDVCIDVPTADVLLEGARRIPSASIARQAIGSLSEPLRFSIDPALRFQKIRFSEEEAAVLVCINNFTTTEEVCAVSPMDCDATQKFIAGLITAGILERPAPQTPAEKVPATASDGRDYDIPDDIFGEPLISEEMEEAVARPTRQAPRPSPSRPAAPPRPKAAAPVAPPPRAVRPSAPEPEIEDLTREETEPAEVSRTPMEEAPEPSTSQPVAAAEATPAPENRGTSEQEAAEQGQIQEVHRRLALMDYYVLLEVDRRSSDAEIRNSYFAIAKKYHPDRAAAPHLKDLKKAMQEVFAQVNKAYEVLKDPEKRRQYDARGGKPEADEREGQSKESDEQIADRNFRMAKTLYDQRKYPEAIQLLKQATRLNPNKGNYFFLLANTLVKSNNRREAEETYLKAIERDKFNSDIYVSLGLLYKASNLAKRAEAMFQKALQLNDNHPVALREMAALKPQGGGLFKSIFKKASDKLQQGK